MVKYILEITKYSKREIIKILSILKLENHKKGVYVWQEDKERDRFTTTEL